MKNLDNNQTEKTKNEKKEKTQKGRIFYSALIVIGVVLVGFSAFRLIGVQLQYSAARNEYQELRDIFQTMSEAPMITRLPVLDGDAPSENADGQTDNQNSAEREAVTPRLITEPQDWQNPMATLLEMNEDFIGWLSIDNLISYPLVQGRNNSRYLYTTFSGSRNNSGAIFMDYRNSADFSDVATIIYGHNMNDGSMFSPLHRLRDNAVLASHQYIIITTPEWDVLTYRILAVRIVNAWDVENNPLQITAELIKSRLRGVPEAANRFLILSTCTPSSNDDERLRIYAVLVD